MKLELKQIELPELPKELNNSHDMIQNVMSRLSTDLLKKVDEAIEEGLKRKGFEFENRYELIEFIKTRCRCEDRVDVKERVYYVDDTPFFLHIYGGEMDLKPTTKGRSQTMTATYGGFDYL